MKPDGWQDCPGLAVGLIGNVFFSFKTPLASNNSFSIKSVIAHTKTKNWRLGLWIDLTNTTKYYNPKQVEDFGIRYIKLPLLGRESPSKAEIDAFIFYCSQFLSENPEQIIGVHCTHGFNRTGFLICSFLCGVKNFDPHVALAKFSECRPPGIYRQNMVNDFIKLYGRKEGAPPPKVCSPPWKNSSDSKKSKNLRTNRVLNAGADNMARSSKKNKSTTMTQDKTDPNSKCSIQSQLAQFSSKGLSQEIQNNVLLEIRKLIEETKSDSMGNNDLPGHCHHYLTHEEFSSLQANRYMVCWQPQECFRYLLFLDAKGSAYLIDAHSSVSSLPSLRFPDGSESSKNIYSTLIDGIILRRKSNTFNQNLEVVFEMTDVLLFEGRNIWCEDMSFRLQLMRQICTAKRNENWAKRSKKDLPTNYLKFNSQPVWSVTNYWKMQRFDWSVNYPVGPNGLIFYPFDNALNLPTLKWTCPYTKTANFRLTTEPTSTGGSKFLICVDDHVVPVDELSSDAEGFSNTLSCLSGAIIECEVTVIDESKSWVFKRESARRICSDSLAFVKSVWFGEMSKNLTTKEVFRYLGSVSSQKTRSTRNEFNRNESVSVSNSSANVAGTLHKSLTVKDLTDQPK